jgi:hypothetical protein
VAVVKFVIRLYAILLRLYPRQFRDEFGDEMQSIFTEALTEAAQRGHLVLIQTCVRELLNLPGAILREYLQARRISMENQSRVSWLELSVAAIPFLLYLVLPVVEELRLGWGGVPFLFLLGGLVIVMIVGLFKGVPRWSLPAIGLMLAILNYLALGVFGMAVVMVILEPLFGISGFLLPLFAPTLVPIFRTIFGSGFLYLGIIPLSLIIILVSAYIKPLLPFFQRIREDWTLFPFTLYGIMPLAIFISFDEYQGSAPYEIGMGLCLLAGVWLYLRISQSWGRILVLGIGITLAMAVEAIGKWILIPSQSWLDLIQPSSIEEIIQGEVTSTVQTWFWVMIVVFLPALLGLLPHSTRLTSATQP